MGTQRGSSRTRGRRSHNTTNRTQQRLSNLQAEIDRKELLKNKGYTSETAIEIGKPTKNPQQKPFTLTLDNESTFNKYFPKLDQEGLEAKYTELWKDFHSNFNGKRGDAWKAFQKKWGNLLAPDISSEKWGDGRPLFKVRFTDKDAITTSAAVGTQVRNWRTKFLTEGSPGTPLALKDTSKQFYDPHTGHVLQIHHEKGISEKGPFIDASIRKLIPGVTDKVAQLGRKEFNTFKEWAHKTGRIFGDKVELLTGLIKDQHVNKLGSAHINRSREGPFYSTRGSGGSALGDDHNLPGEDVIPRRNPKELLDKADRLSFDPNHKLYEPGSIWDLMGDEDDLYYQSSQDATNLARQIANPPLDKEGKRIPNKEIPKNVRQERIDTNDPKKTLPVIKKIINGYLEKGLDLDAALEKAKFEYNRIRLGEYWPKGFDVSKMGLIPTAPILFKGLDLIEAFRGSEETELAINEQLTNSANPPGWDKVREMYINDLKDTGKQFAITSGALGLAGVLTKGAATKAVGGVFGGPVGWTMLGISLADSADNMFLGGAGKEAMEDSKYSYLDPFLGEGMGKKAKEQARENLEKSKHKQLSSFTGI